MANILDIPVIVTEQYPKGTKLTVHAHSVYAVLCIQWQSDWSSWSGFNQTTF